ncbi:MAG: DUF2339 domain-containing protein [Actinomycetota bacterium]|nr:DUF2339 domain-containing protein [Actinomycetota bacterium]
MRYDDDRLSVVERKLDDLTARLERLESRIGAPARPAATPAPPPLPPSHPPSEPPGDDAPRPPTFASARSHPARQIDLEAVLGGRVLAWVGGSAVLLGLVFFLGMALRRGWIDETTRTVLAFLGSAALLGLGFWLHERKGQTEAARVAVATAIAGLYATLVVATQLYDLVAAEIGLACAALVGGAATAIAVRWRSQVVGALGILGALLAPVLVDAGTSGTALAFMILALSSAVGVLLWQRWDWLALGAFAVSAPQLGTWLFDSRPGLPLALGVLAAFWALFVVAAIGYELRFRTPERLPYSSWLLLLANVLVVAAAGYGFLTDEGHANGAIAWVVGLALAHIALGAFALRQAINREIGSLLVAVGLALSAIAFADALGGPALVAGWAIHAALLAYLARRASGEPEQFGSDADRLHAGALAYLGLALGHVLMFEAPLAALQEGVDDLARAVTATAIVAVAAFVIARLVRARDPLPEALDALAAGTLVYLGSITIVDTVGVHENGTPRQAGQVWLSAYWTVLGLVAMVAGLFRNEKRLRIGGLALLGVAAVKVFLYDLAELDELYRVLSFIALGLLLLAGAFAYQRLRAEVHGGDER